MKLTIEKLKKACHCEHCGNYIETKDYSEIPRIKMGKSEKYSFHFNCLIDNFIYNEKFIADYMIRNASK